MSQTRDDTFDLERGLGLLRWGDLLEFAAGICPHATRHNVADGIELAFPLERLAHAVEFKLLAQALFTPKGLVRVSIAGRCGPGVDQVAMHRAISELAGIFGVGIVHAERPQQSWRRDALEITLDLGVVHFTWHVRRRA